MTLDESSYLGWVIRHPLSSAVDSPYSKGYNAALDDVARAVRADMEEGRLVLPGDSEDAEEEHGYEDVAMHSHVERLKQELSKAKEDAAVLRKTFATEIMERGIEQMRADLRNENGNT